MSDEINRLKLKQSLDIDIELMPGHGGVFDVLLDGSLVYTKRQTGRFPEGQEITNLLLELL
ncbi:MAG: Rdx family protein [Candidatus Delongbacteria bacterium]|nr:Rdx family protein [Candidatus Delongbacteria bacterium]